MSLKIRGMRVSDRDDILEISRRIWGGHDYLPSVVDEWLRDRNCHFYGVEVDGRVVAVANLRVVEDGRTGWMEGLRVHPEYRGKGLANEITKYFVEEGARFGVERLRYTTSTENEASLKLAAMAGFSRVLELAVFWHIEPEHVSPVEGYPPIEKVDAGKAYSLLQIRLDVIPSGVLVYDWKALDNTLPNLKEISKTVEFYVAVRKGKVDSISLGCPRREADDAAWSFTICAAESDGFLSQLSHNVAVASERGFSKITCTYEARFEETVKKMNWGQGEHMQTHMVLLERQLHTQRICK